MLKEGKKKRIEKKIIKKKNQILIDSTKLVGRNHLFNNWMRFLLYIYFRNFALEREHLCHQVLAITVHNFACIDPFLFFFPVLLDIFGLTWEQLLEISIQSEFNMHTYILLFLFIFYFGFSIIFQIKETEIKYP